MFKKFDSWKCWAMVNLNQSTGKVIYLVKVTFSVHKLIKKNPTQMTTLYSNLPLYITSTMINYIRQE